MTEKNKPKPQEFLKAGVNLTVAKVIDQIYHLDLAIELWNNELKRAQPLLNGRLIFRFRPRRVRIESETFTDLVPSPGKMVKKVSGAWWFVYLDKQDVYKKLSDLRVGKSMGSDRVVVRLIDGIEAMLERRAELVKILNTLRQDSVAALSSSDAEFNRRIDELKRIKPRIKLDWHNDADTAFKAIKERDATKNAAKAKRKKTA